MIMHMTNDDIDKCVAKKERNWKSKVALIAFTNKGKKELLESPNVYGFNLVKDLEVREILKPNFDLLGSYGDKVVLASDTAVEDALYGQASKEDILGNMVCFTETEADKLLKLIKYNLSTLRGMVGIIK